jgi:hypothetical protein
MLLLTQTTDFLELQTGSPLSTDWTVSFLDVNYATSSFLPGSAEGNVATAATTQIVPPPPDANTQRQLKYISIVNRDAALPQTVVIDKNSSAAYNLTGPIVLNAGDTLQYVDSRGFSVLTAQGQEKFAGLPGATGPAGASGVGAPGLDGDAGEDALHIPGNPGSQGLQGATGAAGQSGFDIMYQEITLEDQWPQGLGSNYPGDNYTFNGLVTVNGVVVANGLITVTAGGLTLLSSTLTLAANTASNHPLKFTTGTLNTTATAGVAEYDGVAHYFTNETTAGRGLVPVEQYFHLTAAGTAITTIANFFGTTSNIPLVAGAYYEIEIVCFFTMGATGSIVTVTLTNSAAPTYMDLCYEMCPITGVVAPPGAATLLAGQIVGGVTAAQTIVTGLLVALSQQYMRMRISLANGTGTSLKIQFAETTTATGLTPNIGSYWRCKRIPAANVGTFAA